MVHIRRIHQPRMDLTQVFDTEKLHHTLHLIFQNWLRNGSASPQIFPLQREKKGQLTLNQMLRPFTAIHQTV